MTIVKQGTFLLLDKEDIRPFLQGQVVLRNIDLLQVHHTWSPNVENFNGSNHFRMLEGMRASHIGRGFVDIAQQFTTFPDGKVGYSLGRPLNLAPAGIKGANSTGICVENVGNYNINGDKMSQAQKDTIIHLYACMAEKFKLPVDTNHIGYHCWWTASGARIGDYNPALSAKTCPGTNFWEDGNRLVDANKNFIPQIANELKRLKNNTTVKEDDPMTPEEKKSIDDLKTTVLDLNKKLESLENSKDSLKEGNQKQDEWLKKMDTNIQSLNTKIDEIVNKQNMQVPEWAKEAYNYFKDSINTPSGSYDFWRNLTIQYREIKKGVK